MFKAEKEKRGDHFDYEKRKGRAHYSLPERKR